MEHSFMEHPWAFGIGVAVGVAVAVVAYKYYKSQKEVATQKREEERLLHVTALMKDRPILNVLTLDDLVAWFDDNLKNNRDMPVKVIAFPSKDTLSGIGLTEALDIDPRHNIIQFFYDNNSGKAGEMRIVGYENIDSNLEAKMLEQDGIIVLEA